MGGALIFDIGGRQTAPATEPKPSRTKAEARTSEHNGRVAPRRDRNGRDALLRVHNGRATLPRGRLFTSPSRTFGRVTRPA